jgi:LmbE family N-acetylglucosaminyl deacetylase
MPLRWDQVQRVLCLGAHADDIEIGCGGTIMSLLEEMPKLEVCWVVLSGDGQRASEAERACKAFCGASRVDLIQESFADSFFPQEGRSIKEYLHELSKRISADLIFTHHRQDRHQDHRLVAELTWNAFRGSTILQYEIPKWEGDLGQPNFYVPLTEAVVQRKAAQLVECFPSQASKPWFDAETFLGLARLRGVEATSPTRFAEAFHCEKLVVPLNSASQEQTAKGT